MQYVSDTVVQKIIATCCNGTGVVLYGCCNRYWYLKPESDIHSLCAETYQIVPVIRIEISTQI